MVSVMIFRVWNAKSRLTFDKRCVCVAVCLKPDINVCKAALQILMWQTHEATCKKTQHVIDPSRSQQQTRYIQWAVSPIYWFLFVARQQNISLCSQSYIFQGWIEVICVNWKLHLVELYIITESQSVSAAPSGVLSWFTCFACHLVTAEPIYSTM